MDANAVAVQASWMASIDDFKSGMDSPSSFLERCLSRIEKAEPQLSAFATLREVAARASAELSTARWQKGAALSVIDGMPIGIKDIIETKDMPTQQGSALFQGYETGRDAASVKALRDAGAIIVGKTVTAEFASVAPGATRNPHDLSRTPGGSSSGSAAAVGAGFVSAALGTQVVGSTLRPASYCGCHGFKPTVGALNRGGSFDYLSQSTTGIIGASLADVWQVAIEIARRCGGDPGYRELEGPNHIPRGRAPKSFGLIKTAGWSVATSSAKRSIEEALARCDNAGVEIVTAESNELIANIEKAMVDAMTLTMDINVWESRWPIGAYRDIDSALISREMLRRLDRSGEMTAAQYNRNLDRRDVVRSIWARLRDRIDACITLSAPDCAPIGIEATGNPVFAIPSSLLGVPALSLPLLQTAGLPLGLQVLGFSGADADLFAVACWIEKLLLPNSHLARSGKQRPSEAVSAHLSLQ